MFLEQNKEAIQECLSAINQDSIAEIAGVVKQTVSNAFTGAGSISVSDATKERIAESAMELIEKRYEKAYVLIQSFKQYKSNVGI